MGIFKAPRATTAERLSITPSVGELIYDTDLDTFWYGDGVTAGGIEFSSGGGGSGTVTTVSVVSANGVSGSVANATTTPAITLALGAITPSSVAAVGAVTGSNLSGTNTGDQTSIVGITGTLAEFNTALTGADFATGGGTATGTNTGDQTSIVGITGTKAQFDGAVTDGNFLYVGDVTQYTDEMAQDAVGSIVDGTLIYTDSTPLLSRAALTGDVTAPAGSNTTTIAAGVIVNADINGSAAIDASKIADGTVSSSEFQFINTLSSNAQTQLNAKLENITGLVTAGSNVSISGLGTSGSPYNISSTASGTGDVVGPGSATDNAIVRFDGTTGKLIQNSAATIADTSGNISAGTFNGNTIGAGSTSGTNTGDQTSIVGITGSLSDFNTALTGADFATGGGTVTGASSGTNTGDQTSIVGITGSLAEFNTALTGADFATGGGTVTGTSSGTNTGDQTSIVGITGTKAQFDTAVSDGNILFVGDVTQYTDEMAQDAVGGMVNSTLTYVDGTPSLGINLGNANTWTADQSVPDEAYGVGWNGSVEVPTKNAIYDKIEAIPALTDGDKGDITVSSSGTVWTVDNGVITSAKTSAGVQASLGLADTSVQLAFKTIAVAGQSDIVADTATDTLTIVAGSNITLTTNAGTDTLTIAASGGSGSFDYGKAYVISNSFNSY